VDKAGHKIIKNSLKYFGVKATNELVVISNKLKYDSEGLVTNGLGPAVACRPPFNHVVLHNIKLCTYFLSTLFLDYAP
jgi:hypothetical protein